MTDLTCAEVEDAATEYALGILPAAEARAISDHLATCPSCRLEIDQIATAGDWLLELVPDAEPPLGFDRKVLTALHLRPTRWRRNRALVIASCAAAAAALVVALSLAALTGNSGRPHTAELTATLRQGNRTVGSVYVGGSPTWVITTVQNATLTGTVTCQLITADGTRVTVGEFQIVDGQGTWSAPDPGAASHPVAAQLIARDGEVMASATFATA